QGYMVRTQRGRMVTSSAYQHFGVVPPKPGKVNGEFE
ncbi:MAG: Holliday junction branch migration DNA helicase RuvB, partial [Marinobacter sp.]